MPLAPAIAHENAAVVAGTFAIYLGPQDVMRFTPIESVRIEENGPGSVSAMSFVVEDPTNVVGLPLAGSVIEMRNLTNDYPMFLGILGDYTVEPMGIGRMISVNAVGIEIVLDWTAVPSTFIGSLATARNILGEVLVGVRAVIQDLAAYGAWAGLVAPTNQLGVDPTDGNAAHPIGRLNFGAADPLINFDPPHFAGPSDLRTAIDYSLRTSFVGGGNTDALFTVDFYRNLRVFRRGHRPDDWTDLTVTDTTAGPLVASNIKYEIHPAEVIRAVYVVGGNAAGTGTVTDGSGINGNTDVLNVAASLSVNQLNEYGTKYLLANSALVRGTLTLEDYVPPVGTVHPGSFITITDAQVSLSAQTYAIASITKTFPGGTLQNWEIAFGSSRPSFIDQVALNYSTDATWTNRLAGGLRS